MHRCHSDVQCIAYRFGGQSAIANQSARQSQRGYVEFQQRKLFKDTLPLSYGLLIAGAGFLNDQLGDIEIEIGAAGRAICPPNATQPADGLDEAANARALTVVCGSVTATNQSAG